MIEGSDCPVAVHVRRGDYKNLGEMFALCDESYYKAAFAAVEKGLPFRSILFSATRSPGFETISSYPGGCILWKRTGTSPISN